MFSFCDVLREAKETKNANNANKLSRECSMDWKSSLMCLKLNCSHIDFVNLTEIVQFQKISIVTHPKEG